MNQKLNYANNFTYMLAPLENTSDTALRNLCHKYGADLTFTEMARLDALARKNNSTWQKISILDNTPTVIQIAGAKEQSLKDFLKSFKPEEQKENGWNFQGFNLNLGCPSPEVIRQGLGCAMIKRISLTKRLVALVRDSGYSCSIKMRLGLNAYEKKRKIYLNLINAFTPEEVDFFAIHARHAGQDYTQKADYTIYSECVKSGNIIIANGDIKSIPQVKILKAKGVHGVMIGRNAVYDPAIFNRLKGLQGLQTPDSEQLKKEYVELADKYQTPGRNRLNVVGRIGKAENIYKTKAELMNNANG